MASAFTIAAVYAFLLFLTGNFLVGTAAFLLGAHCQLEHSQRKFKVLGKDAEVALFKVWDLQEYLVEAWRTYWPKVIDAKKSY